MVLFNKINKAAKTIITPSIVVLVALIFFIQLFLTADYFNEKNDNHDFQKIVSFYFDNTDVSCVYDLINSLPISDEIYSNIYLSRVLKSNDTYYAISAGLNRNDILNGELQVNSYFLDFCINNGVLSGTDMTGLGGTFLGNYFSIDSVNDNIYPMVSDDIYMHAYCSYTDFVTIVKKVSIISFVFDEDISARDFALVENYLSQSLSNVEIKENDFQNDLSFFEDNLVEKFVVVLMIFLLLICCYSIFDYDFEKKIPLYRVFVLCGCKPYVLILIAYAITLINLLIGIVMSTIIFVIVKPLFFTQLTFNHVLFNFLISLTVVLFLITSRIILKRLLNMYQGNLYV